MFAAQVPVATVVAIAVGVVVVFGALFFAVAAVRPRREGTGTFDRKAVKRDETRRKLEAAQRAAAERVLVLTGAEPRAEIVEAITDAEAGVRGALAKIDEGETEVYARPVVEPPDPIEVGITRRQILNRGAVIGSGVGLVALGGASVAFLIPAPTKGFGGEITVPATIRDIKQEIEDKGEPYYVAEARTYLMDYTAEDEELAREVYAEIWDSVEKSGLMPMFQKCPHLGCRVPWCDSSQWFECPCHGSQYNAAGEKKAGPAPRGLDRFKFQVSGESLTINTGELVEGPTVGVDTTAQKAAGEHCV